MEVGSRVFVEIRKPPTITITDISKEATAGETARTQYRCRSARPDDRILLRPPPHTPLLVGLAPPPPHIATEPSSRFEPGSAVQYRDEANSGEGAVHYYTNSKKLNSTRETRTPTTIHSKLGKRLTWWRERRTGPTFKTRIQEIKASLFSMQFQGSRSPRFDPVPPQDGFRPRHVHRARRR